MSLENSETGSPIANAGVGSGGATAAQVRQALDESGSSGTGAGIKVGVLSDSFNDLGGAVADEANGALPSASNIQVISDLASGGTDEGRAMMQIIHDIAPGASLAFYTAFNSEQDFANGILALAAAGSKVIVDDVSYSDEPFFQNGVVARRRSRPWKRKASLTLPRPAMTAATVTRPPGRRYRGRSTELSLRMRKVSGAVASRPSR